MKTAKSKQKSMITSARRTLYVMTYGAMAAAFVPGPHVRPPNAGVFSCASANPLTPEAKNEPGCLPRRFATSSRTTVSTTAADAAVSCTSAGTTNNGVARATAPVLLVGSDRAVLENFADHLWASETAPTAAAGSNIIDLAEIARSEGARGVQKALAGSKTDGVLVCRSTLCLDDPEVESMVHAHPLTVHLAIDDEDPDARERCERATKYTVVVGEGKEEEDFAKADLSRLVMFARRPKPSASDVALDMGKNTFFLSLTFEDFAPHKDLLPALTEGVDAMELRVDLLADTEDPYSVLRQLSILRRHTGYLPVVFTIRSKGQCGAFPDDPEKLFRLARWGLRAGCEVMDVEANWPMSYREELTREARETYPGAMLVGSYHVVGKKTTEDQAKDLFMECYHDGAVDAVKVC